MRKRTQLMFRRGKTGTRRVFPVAGLKKRGTRGNIPEDGS